MNVEASPSPSPSSSPPDSHSPSDSFPPSSSSSSSLHHDTEEYIMSFGASEPPSVIPPGYEVTTPESRSPLNLYPPNLLYQTFKYDTLVKELMSKRSSYVKPDNVLLLIDGKRVNGNEWWVTKTTTSTTILPSPLILHSHLLFLHFYLYSTSSC